ncbi:MAG: ParA family protein [Nanobdellota archaeon]
MRSMCVINRKGGVGKTTTAVSVAAKLALEGKKVLLVDFDPQGNISQSLKNTGEKTMYDILTGNSSVEESTVSLGKNLDIIPSNEKLTKVESYANNQDNPNHLLKQRFSQVAGYEYIIFDCAPSLGILNQNAMLFCKEALIPASTRYLSIAGLTSMLEAIEDINTHFKHDLTVKYIVPTLHDKRNKTNKEMHHLMRTRFGKKVTNPIRINSKLAEAPAAGKSIFMYDKSCRGAKDYEALVEHIIHDEKLERPQQPIHREQSQEPISARVQRIMADIQVED